MHAPVLLNEVIELLQPQPGQHFIDGTLGGGGHAETILKHTAPDGKLLGIDRDQVALQKSQRRLSQFQDRATLAHGSFHTIKKIYNEQFSSNKISGILLDLGLSSFELEDTDRGFSFQIADAPLDMRFDVHQELTAADIVNTWPDIKLTQIIQEYGQEKSRLARAITNQIIVARRQAPITKTKRLVQAILLAYREVLGSTKEVPWIGGIHPATKTFQALRIAVNDELNILQQSLPDMIDVLSPGRRIAVISFHSLEDRIVKRYFREQAQECVCPPDIPVCRCRHQATVRVITKKPITPGEQEIKTNPRSRSAKLRVAEKI